VGAEDEAVAALADVGRMDRTRVRDSVVDRFDVARMVDDYLGLYQRVITEARLRTVKAR
jgi:hypothetical protein